MNDADTSFTELLGYVIGVVVGVAFPIIALVLNLLALQRRSTNHRGAIAIILAITAWLVLLMGAMMVRTLPLHSPLRLVPFSICLLLTLASAVLAVIGLIEFNQHRHRYRRGKRRALIALVIDIFFIVLLGYGLMSGWQNRTSFGKMTVGLPMSAMA